jgi:hypothetical protein
MNIFKSISWKMRFLHLVPYCRDPSIWFSTEFSEISFWKKGGRRLFTASRDLFTWDIWEICFVACLGGQKSAMKISVSTHFIFEKRGLFENCKVTFQTRNYVLNNNPRNVNQLSSEMHFSTIFEKMRWYLYIMCTCN